jgi:protein-disulfide isomerase-like protein with CxxC motif
MQLQMQSMESKLKLLQEEIAKKTKELNDIKKQDFP